MKRFILVLTILFLAGLSAEITAQTRAIVYTNLGTFTLELREDLVPITAGNFISLTDAGFYDGIIFHRVVDGFVIQGGDPTGTGSGGSGTTIPDEFTDSLSNTVRTISMANSGPNTGTSQFFINMVNNTFLDYDKAPLSSAHPVFGEVVEGWDVVQDIEAVPVNASDRPLTDVVMDSVRIDRPVSSLSNLAANIRSYSLHPNPVDASSRLELVVDRASTVTLSIVDASGKAVGEARSFAVSAGKSSIRLEPMSLSALQTGAYFLMLLGEEGDLRTVPFIR